MPSRKLTSKQRWEARKKKRREVEQSYRDYTPPQVRHLRWLKRVGQA